MNQEKRGNMTELLPKQFANESVYERYARTVGLEMFSDSESAFADFLYRKYLIPIYVLSYDEIDRTWKQYQKRTA